MLTVADAMSDLTAIIKTFERPTCLDRLIRSIRTYYPTLRIIVADDGYNPTPREDVDYLRLPPDVGVSAGRNALLEQVRTPYFLLLDDDLRFTEQTQIERLLEVARRSPKVIAGGTYLRCKRKLGMWVRRRPQPYHAIMLREADTLTLKRGWHGHRDDHYECDLIHNFYVARTKDIREIGAWDARLKTQEHEEFFIRTHKAGMHIAYCPEVIAEHWNAGAPRRYRKFRNRNYLAFSLALHGIRTFTTPDGRQIDIPPLESFSIKDDEYEPTQLRHGKAA